MLLSYRYRMTRAATYPTATSHQDGTRRILAMEYDSRQTVARRRLPPLSVRASHSLIAITSAGCRRTGCNFTLHIPLDADSDSGAKPIATTVREAMTIEHPCLLPLADQGFQIEETLFPIVNGNGCVRVKTNSYSSPLPAGGRPLVKVWPLHVDIYEDLTRVATHPRCYGRGHDADLPLLAGSTGRSRLSWRREKYRRNLHGGTNG